MSDNGEFKTLNELLGGHPGTIGNPDDEGIPGGEVPEFHAPVVFEEGTNRSETTQEETDDFNLARKTLHSLIEKGQVLLESALYEATQSGGHPRSVEVANQVINGLSGTTKDLLELHQKLKKLQTTANSNTPSNPDQSSGHVTHNNTLVFTGTTKEAIEQLRKMKESEDIIDAEVIEKE